MRYVPNPISVAVTSNTDNGYIRKRSTFTLGKGGHLKMTKLILEEIRAGAVVTVERINEDENEGTVPEALKGWGQLDELEVTDFEDTHHRWMGTTTGAVRIAEPIAFNERWPLGGYE